MNPIIQRELVGLLRTRRALALQIALVASLGLLIIARWPDDAMVDLSLQQSQKVLRLFGYGLMVAMILLVPIFPATTVVRERQQGTLTLLLNSPMGPWSILMGKLLGVLGFALLLLVLSLPAAAACFTMGGVGVTQLLMVYGLLALVAVQYAALGLLVSSYAATTESALRATYAIIFVMAVVTLGPHQFRQGLDASGLADVVDWTRCVSPIPAMMEVLGHEAIGSRGLLGAGSQAGRYALLALVSIVLFCVWIAARFRMRLFDRPRASGDVTDEQTVAVRSMRRVMYMWYFDPQRRSGLIGPLTNPVMVKEFRSRRFGRAHWMMRLLSLCLVVSMGLMLATTTGTMDWGVTTLGTIMVLLTGGLILLITPSLASGLISGERESGGWELLQLTPLSTFTIVTGKLASVAVTLLLILLATLPGYGVIIAIDNAMTEQVTRVLLSLTLTAVFAVLLSAAVSSLFRRTALATATAYTLLLGLTAGTLLFWLGEGDPVPRHVVEMALRFNPLAAPLVLINAPGFAGYDLLPFNWYVMAVGCAAATLVLVVQTWRLTRPQ